MSSGRQVSCVLCQRSEETAVTGALSTKDHVTAHQNCLLFSAGIYCQSSPEFDDLFGFSVDDVMKEVRRGSKLICKRCKKKGATVGCEVKWCQKSYHYPCAILEGSETIEDQDKGNYWLYCLKHYQQLQGSEKNSSVNRLSNFTKPRTSKKPSGVQSSKTNTNGDSSAAGPSRCSSDSDSSGISTHFPPKRPSSLGDIQEETPSKRKRAERTIFDDSSDSDKNEPNTDIEIFAPLESDIDENANSVPEHQSLTVPQFIRGDAESPTEETSGNRPEDENRGGDSDKEETIILSDAESESLLLPVEICIESQTLSAASVELSPQTESVYPRESLTEREDEGSSPEKNPVHSPDPRTAGPSVPQHVSTGPPPSPDHLKPHSVAGSPPCTSSAISPAPAETVCVSLSSPPSSPAPTAPPTAPPSDPEPRIDSSCFWKSCNAAGCTQAIFTDFINEMKEVSSRIQSDQASQGDYDLALKVMAASGSLTDLVAKQQKELQRKQMELTKAAAAMKEVVSALKR